LSTPSAMPRIKITPVAVVLTATTLVALAATIATLACGSSSASAQTSALTPAETRPGSRLSPATVPADTPLFTRTKFLPINFARTEILTQQLAPGFYALTGSPDVDPGHLEAAGGRIGVLVGSDGIFMVDATYAPLTDKVVAAIRRLSPAPIRFLVNTHFHPDHTGGNPNFARLGATVLAREEVFNVLAEPLPPPLAAAIGNAASQTDPDRLPTITYRLGSHLQFHMNGETIDIIGIPPAHTNGDTLVRFEKADVIMIGDFYRDYGYPFVDLAHGGSFAGVLAALDMVEKLAGPNTRLVPGHGTIVDRSAIPAYRDMIESVRKSVASLLAEHKSRQEILGAKLTASYDQHVPGGLTATPLGDTSAWKIDGTSWHIDPLWTALRSTVTCCSASGTTGRFTTKRRSSGNPAATRLASCSS
jgi:cyclase